MLGRSVGQELDARWLDAVVGGDDDEGGQADPSGGEPAEPAQVDNSAAEPTRNFDGGAAPEGSSEPYDGGGGEHQDDGSGGEHQDDGALYGASHDASEDPSAHHGPIDPEQAIQSMVPMPEMPEAPHFDAPTHTSAGPSADEMFRTRVDIAQNYADLASPSELHQGARGDCFNVAALNVLNAENPDYIHQLAQETRREGIYNVGTLDRQGNEHDVYVRDTPIRGGATTDDSHLQAVYNATSLLYHPGRPGGDPGDAMERVGASTSYLSPTDAALAYQNGDGAAILSTPNLTRATPEAQQALRDVGLYDNHAYQMAAVIHNDADGRDYAVLRNPWGSGTPDNPGNVHPAPIPVEDLHRYFASGVVGTTRY